MNYNTNEEIWKDIDGYDGFYQVSNLGNVRSFKYGKPRVLKPHHDKKFGYARLILRRDGKSFPHTVHRLVAEAFIENPLELPVINHKDENPRNNHVSNLEWCTYQYNNTYGTMRERVESNTDYKAIGDKNSIRVLQLDLYGQPIKEWKSATECKRMLGYDNSSIAKCCRGVMDSAYGYKWQYVQ